MTGALWLITTRGPLRFLPNQFSNRTLQNSRELIANLPFGNLRTKLGFRMKQSRQRSVRSTCQSLATGVESQVTSRWSPRKVRRLRMKWPRSIFSAVGWQVQSC